MRCLGCFEEFNEEWGVCPSCGYIVGTKAEEAIFIEPGTKIRGRYIIGRDIGFGGFGVTYIAWDEVFQQKVAIKEYLPSEFSTRVPGQTIVRVFEGEKDEQFHDGMREFINEAKRLAKFKNEPGIVKIFDSFEENNTAYIVMEYLNGETLTDYLEKYGIIDEATAIAMLMPVMESLKRVHKEGILHRDIAPDNIFLTKDADVKLIDFGAARYATTSHSMSLTVIIKPGFSPEEQYRTKSNQGPHTDVYAIAATLYKMMTGVTPPDALERRAKYETKSRDVLKSPRKLNKSISRVSDVAILNAMNVKVEDRTPDIDTFISELTSDTPVKRVYGKIKKIDIYRWPIWIKRLVVLLFGAIAIFGALLATGRITFQDIFVSSVSVPEGMVIVPQIEGMKSDKAISKIEKSGLIAKTAGNIESEYVEAGKIVFQEPGAKMYAPKDSEVLITVSSGKQEVVEPNPEDDKLTMPYIIWDTLEAAIEKLSVAGFAEPEVEYAFDDAVQEGQVISANINNGDKVEKGTKVKLIVSKGSEKKPVESTPPTETSSTTENKPKTETPQQKPVSHTHIWVDVTKTIHHDAVTKQVWVENPAEEYWYFDLSSTCGECGNVASVTCGPYSSSSAAENAYSSGTGRGDLDRLTSGHKVAMGDAHKSSGYNPSYWVETAGGGGYYKEEIVSDAYDEVVVTGQKCSTCGATK